MCENRYWVGVMKDTGAMWVYDPDMPHEDNAMVYAFYVSKTEMREYPKAQVKTMLTTLRDERREKAIDSYTGWKLVHGASFLQEQKDIKENRRNEAIAKHMAYVKEHGANYEGIRDGSSRTHRTTHCYECKQPLESSLHVECNSCNWLICYCGACGCGFGK